MNAVVVAVVPLVVVVVVVVVVVLVVLVVVVVVVVVFVVVVEVVVVEVWRPHTTLKGESNAHRIVYVLMRNVTMGANINVYKNYGRRFEHIRRPLLARGTKAA